MCASAAVAVRSSWTTLGPALPVEKSARSRSSQLTAVVIPHRQPLGCTVFELAAPAGDVRRRLYLTGDSGETVSLG
jgi:hypothetical protein